MPVAMVVVDVPTAVCNKSVAQALRGPWAEGPDELYACRRVMGETPNEEGEQPPAARGRVVDGVPAGRKHSSPPSSSYGERMPPPRSCTTNAVESPKLRRDSCVTLPVLGRKELLDLAGRQLTALPCLHDMAAKTRHGSGAKAAAQVRTLQLSRNGLKSLLAASKSLQSAHPIALADFTKVVLLDVSRNEIATLAGVERMASLRFLHASHNKIEDLGPLFSPDSLLPQSAALRVLDVGFNQIRRLLPDPGGALEKPLRSLHTITLSYNHLTELNDLDMLFPNILELRVARNQLTGLPQVIPKRICRIELQQNYFDEAAQNHVREIQRRMRCLREIDISEQRTRQEDTSEAGNTASRDGVHGMDSEDDGMENGVCPPGCFAVDDVAMDGEDRDTPDAVAPHSIDEGPGGGVGQMQPREMKMGHPPTDCAPLQETPVQPAAAWACQGHLQWPEHPHGPVAAMLARVMASATLRSSHHISCLWVQPQITEWQPTGALALIYKISHTELLVSSIRLSVDGVHRDRVALRYETRAAPLASAGRPPLLFLTQSTRDPHGLADKMGVVEEDEETPAPQQRQRQQRGEDHSPQALTASHASTQSFMPKRNLFTHGVSGRQWLLDELRAPLNWSETGRCHRPFDSCLLPRRTKQERVDRRRKTSGVCDTQQGETAISSHTVL